LRIDCGLRQRLDHASFAGHAKAALGIKAMPDVPITVASGDYDRIRALRDGPVKIEGCAVDYHVVEPNQLFVRNLKAQEFDVSEMSFSTYVTLREQGRAHYTAIPVFLSRAFRHSAIFVRSDGGIATPADLTGRRVGTPEYFTTMLVWMRGLLADEYGVAPSDLRWLIGGLEQPSSDSSAAQAPPFASEGSVDIQPIPSGKTLSGMLADGEIDAVFSARPPSCFCPLPKADAAKSQVVRLFPDYRAAEQAYYRSARVYPLMHAVGIRNSLVERHPWMAERVYAAFAKAKAIAVANFEKLSAFAITLPWIEAEYRATQAVLGEDIWPYGIAANAGAIETLCRYLHEQGFTRRRIGIGELFAPMPAN
jgi:4,5-dihydroxyphthalate decarboxylase